MSLTNVELEYESVEKCDCNASRDDDDNQENCDSGVLELDESLPFSGGCWSPGSNTVTFISDIFHRTCNSFDEGAIIP